MASIMKQTIASLARIRCCKPPPSRSLAFGRSNVARGKAYLHAQAILTSHGDGGNSGSGGTRRPVFGGSDGNHGPSGSTPRLGLWALLAVAGQVVMAGSASASIMRGKPKKEEEMTIDRLVNSMWAVSGPVLTNLGFSGCMGAMAGVALKKVGQLLAVVVGTAFVAIQALAYAGFITVNWTHVHKRITQAFDINHDGKVDERDFKLVFGKGLGVLAEGVPSVGGFLAGFALGIRM